MRLLRKIIPTIFLLITFILLLHNTVMVEPHAGSWFGLPDFGITEKISSIGAQLAGGYSPTTAQGGSNILGSQTQNTGATNPQTGTTYNTVPVDYTYVGAPKYSSQGNPQVVVNNPTPSGNPPPSQPTDPLKQQTSKYGYYNANGDWVSLGNYISPEGNYYGGTEQDYMNEINQGYNAAQGYYNTAEQNLNTQKSAMEKQAEADYLANQGQLGTQRTSALGQLETQQRAGQTRKEDALSAARRLYSELQRGNIQRFGGASSAGQAASEIQGAEAQRQFGQTNRQANEFFQQIETARQDVESKYQSGLLQLQQAKQQALTQAQLEFSNKMTEIARGRAETEQQKSQMRLNALMDLRNKAFTIQQQQTQFEQQLQAMREQSLLNIQQYQATAGKATQAGSNAYGQFNQNTTTSPTSQYGLGLTTQQVQQLPQGVIGRSTNQGGQIWDPIQGRWVAS